MVTMQELMTYTPAELRGVMLTCVELLGDDAPTSYGDSPLWREDLERQVVGLKARIEELEERLTDNNIEVES